MSATVTHATKSHSSLATRLPRDAKGHSPLHQRKESQAFRVNHLPALFLAIPSEDRRSLPGSIH